MLRLAILSAILLPLASCQPWGQSPHEKHAENMVAEGLLQEASRWESSARYALNFPIGTSLPYAERRILDVDTFNRATAFEIALSQEQRINIVTLPSRNSRAPVFIDIFEKGVGDAKFKRLASKENHESSLQFDAPRKGSYFVRIQPGYQAKGLVDITIASQPRFPFPVENYSAKAVQSFFGASRDAGKRKHKGIDIFAKRGTPVLSVSSGRVYKAADTPRGGLNVWVRHEGYSFYYAHLDRIDVKQGQTLKVGQQLGTVGNSGNARTTRPHLHFGIYKGFRGAIDPFPLVDNSHEFVERDIKKVTLVPRWLAVDTAVLNVREGPGTDSTILQKLKRHMLVQVEAMSGDWLRVATAEGFHGYVARHLMAKPEVTSWKADKPYHLVSEPYAQAPVLMDINEGEVLESFGGFGRFRMVRMESGLTAWAKSSTGDSSAGTSSASSTTSTSTPSENSKAGA